MHWPITAPPAVDSPGSDDHPLAESGSRIEPTDDVFTSLRVHFHRGPRACTATRRATRARTAEPEARLGHYE